MSRSSFTASERRGVLAIALVALAIIGAGLGISFCKRSQGNTNIYPIVTEHRELVDSTTIIMEKGKEKVKKPKEIKSKKNNNSNKGKKYYRRRSPLDEPV